ncbi:hypoxanthine phosphoribosyltransferase [Anaerovibrio sp.]|uniref:hypoxanthine phosphoribosyltransferase n=1 Tax=Anaerovibrio sp. TaxID=1872532 RepID=UPI001B57F8EB|nr:hypoxanthine phosphoribosyltransferase [Anaerovibrio sp.]MBP3232134.1 hypoxanthine phosphoribosyltransferase [Anaerovibrio sp.]MBR2143614.1 hypoxanthine phosphoribosyltransferase [Anaerovibrio sp.]
MLNDLERVMFDEKTIAERIAELGQEITRDYAGKDIVVVGILKGSVVFFSDLIRQIKLPLNIDFIVASSYGDGAETSGRVNIKKDLEKDIAGRDVLLVEDIIDSGVTMNCLMDILNKRQPASVKLCALLTKEPRRQIPVKIDYCGFDVPDEFLVGYGLDYAEKYRNLPVIGVLKREIYS